MVNMKITIEHTKDVNDFTSSTGLHEYGQKYIDLEKIPEILEHKPKSIYGGVYLARLCKNKPTNFYCWIKPTYGGVYSWEYPIFKITNV